MARNRLVSADPVAELGGWPLTVGFVLAVLLGAAVWARCKQVGLRDLKRAGRSLADLGDRLRLPRPGSTSARIGALVLVVLGSLVVGGLLAWAWWPLALAFGLGDAFFILVLCCRFWGSR